MHPSDNMNVIAVATDALAPFHQEVIDGLRPQFARAGFGMLTVTGRDVSTNRFEQPVDATNTMPGSMASRLKVAGALIVSGATPPGTPDDEIARFATRLTDGPVASLGVRLPGVASIVIDWDDTIDELVAHMTRDPRRRRFVFIRGYAGDPHTIERENGFRSGMHAAGLAVHEDLIVSGDYSVAASMHAMSQLIADGKQFDGIIAGNDDMATGAIAALRTAGISVPDQVIVAGFDNAWTALTSVPRLTTARLNTRRLTQTSAEVLLDAIRRGESLDPNLLVSVDSELIVRESSRVPEHEPDGVAEPDGLDLALRINEHLRTRLEAPFAPDDIDVAHLADATTRTLLTAAPDFTELTCGLRVIAEHHVPNTADVIWWTHAVRELFDATMGIAMSDGPPPGLDIVLGQLRHLASMFAPLEAQFRTQQAALREVHDRLVMRLAACSDLDALWATLRSGLESLGMNRAWVAVSDEPEMSSGSAMRLLFSLSEHHASNERFDKSDVLPTRYASLLESDLHVLVPLRVGSSDMGYMVFEPTDERLMGLEAIASSVAQVLRHVEHVAVLEDSATQLREANSSLDRMARFDSLTGLANRQLFVERLRERLDSASPHEEVALMFLDLDGFKQINDTLGHEAGDRLLQTATGRVLAVLGADDHLARLGGDEFTITLTQSAGSSRSARLADAVLTAIAEPCLLGTSQVSVSASLGIAFAPGDGDTVDQLLRNADAAMYEAKSRGKNRSATFTPALARPGIAARPPLVPS